MRDTHFALLACALLSTPLTAEEFEQHHAHEHGKVTLNVAVTGPALVLELDAPAVNVLGFEHAPKTDAERAASASAAALFQSGRELIGTPKTARCRFVGAELTQPTWASHDEHADYEARLTYDCADPRSLTWFEPWFMQKLLHVEALRVNLITPTGQRTELSKTAHARISLR
jgi:hypothetical protein